MPKSIDVAKKQAAAMVLASRYLNKPTLSLLASRDVNTTFIASSGKNKLVIRIADKQTMGRQHVKEYQRAAQASELVAVAGIRTRKMLLTGDSLVPYAYQVSEFIDGQTAVEYQGDEIAIWEQIGQLAKQINSVKTKGFGDEPFDKPAGSWHDYITEHINGIIKFQKNPSNERVQQEVRFSPQEVKHFEKLLLPLKDLNPDLRLIHGDLGPHNVIVDNKGKVIAVIDWDMAKSFPIEHQVALCTFWNSYQEPRAMARHKAFIKGYGQEFDPALVKTFQIYEYLTQLPFHIHQPALQVILRSLSGLYNTEVSKSQSLQEELAGNLA